MKWSKHCRFLKAAVKALGLKLGTSHTVGPTPLSLIPTDEDKGRDGLLACHSLDAAAGRAGHCPKLVRRKGKKPEVIVVRPIALRRQGPP